MSRRELSTGRSAFVVPHLPRSRENQHFFDIRMYEGMGYSAFFTVGLVRYPRFSRISAVGKRFSILISVYKIDVKH